MTSRSHILAAADRCVMCGLCLPHCPTYQLRHCETESPRGRIALMQALAGGQLAPSAALQRHLDSCLVCRACERMCPSKVPYGELIDASRALLHGQGAMAAPPVRRLLEQVKDPAKLHRNGALLRRYQQSGAQRLLRGSGLLRALGLEGMEAQLPLIPPATTLAAHTAARGAVRGRIGLFTGCIGSLLEGELHQAAVDLLSRLGYEVVVPATQGCCGALHLHNGEPQQAAQLARNAIALFDGLHLDAVVTTASGCAGHLGEYPTRYGGGETPFYEICDFLAQGEWPAALPLKAVAQRVLLHLPCSQRNVLRRPEAVAQLLGHIPQLVCEPLAENHLCCGAAGSYQLSERNNAVALRERKLDWIGNDKARLLVSNNLGCALHLQQGLRQRGMAMEVVHPLLLLRQALG
ncbi:MAG: (Fe-S)-binding protein [Gammaproteobacteria bacterium]|nr:(Fe-S)-binding protein [Gammaproteobacteria bacterium]